MTLIASRWRLWLVLAGVASAVALACEGRWALVPVPLVIALAPVLVRAGAEIAEDWRTVRESWRPATGKHCKPPQMPYTCSRCGGPGVTVWSSEEAAATGQRLGMPLVCDACLVGALRMVARSAG